MSTSPQSSKLSYDPFPDIPCALLNSADIQDYVNATRMIDPYEPDRLDAASYTAHLAGPIYIYKHGEEDGPIRKDADVPWELPNNTIAYVNIDTTFNLPDYIALRFNLRVGLVHMGLLLGTGPLIDPGFTGNILIPLHNLTNNTYKFRKNHPLIKIEFTKISTNSNWKCTVPVPSRTGTFKKQTKVASSDTFQLLRDILKEQNQSSVVSSMEGVLRAFEETTKGAQQSAKEAESSALSAKQTTQEISAKFRNFGIAGLFALGVALASLTLTSYRLITSTRSELDSKISAQHDQISALSREISLLQRINDNKSRAFSAKGSTNSNKGAAKIKAETAAESKQAKADTKDLGK